MTDEHDTINSSNKPIDEKTSNIVIPVLRFNFTSSIMNELSSFAKIHKHDTRADFKNAWNLWIQNNQQIIHTETLRLQQLGFTGIVIDKMFKSVRYYFRQKTDAHTPQPTRKKYECIHKPVLSAIDKQIITIIQNNATNSNDEKTTCVSSISPAYAFDMFCTDHFNLIHDAIRIYYSTDIISISKDMIITYVNKLKKTYKNRFYNIKVSGINKK